MHETVEDEVADDQQPGSAKTRDELLQPLRRRKVFGGHDAAGAPLMAARLHRATRARNRGAAGQGFVDTAFRLHYKGAISGSIGTQMIVVTGGAGMIGSNIVAALNARGRSDILVVDDLTDGHKIDNLADLADRRLCSTRTSSCRAWRRAATAHRGGLPPGRLLDHHRVERQFMMEVNYSLFQAPDAGLPGAAKVPFLYASSASVYGGGSEFREEPECERPLNVYAYSKKLFDDYVRQDGVRHRPQPGRGPALFQRLRAARGAQGRHGIGRLPSVQPDRARRKRQSCSARMTVSGRASRAATSSMSSDVADVNLWLWNRGASGIFNCGTGRAQPFRAVAETVIATLGKGADRISSTFRTAEGPLPELYPG